MKLDGEEIKAVSKNYFIAGAILFVISCILLIIYISHRQFLKAPSNINYILVGTSFFSGCFISSFCFIGDKSAIIGIYRNFYSDIAKIKYRYTRYIITMPDGTERKSSVMFGVSKLNSELKNQLPQFIID